MKLTSGYFLRRNPCPCCDAGPLVLVECSHCGVIIGWCGELQYAVGRIDGDGLFPFNRGEHADWARKHCPACGAAADGLRHAEAPVLQAVGIRSSGLMWSAPDGSIHAVDPEW